MSLVEKQWLCLRSVLRSLNETININEIIGYRGTPSRQQMNIKIYFRSGMEVFLPLHSLENKDKVYNDILGFLDNRFLANDSLWMRFDDNRFSLCEIESFRIIDENFSVIKYDYRIIFSLKNKNNFTFSFNDQQEIDNFLDELRGKLLLSDDTLMRF